MNGGIVRMSDDFFVTGHSWFLLDAKKMLLKKTIETIKPNLSVSIDVLA